MAVWSKSVTMFRNLSLINVKYCSRWTNKLCKSVKCRYFSQETCNLGSVMTDKDNIRFEETFSRVVDCLTTSNDTRLKSMMEYYRQVMEYNVPHGSQRMGLLTVAAYKILDKTASEQQLHRASIMGWAVEVLKASFLISDDIVDDSLTRHGQLCWHRKEEVGLTSAVNDISLLENFAYKLLKIHFRDEKYYTNVMDLFHDITLCTNIGQQLDIRFPKKDLNISDFNEDNYNLTCYYKTFLVMYYFPIALAMYMAGIEELDFCPTSFELLKNMAKLVQIRNDYLDCFGRLNQTGKIGTDIQSGKCSWLILRALEMINEEEAQKLLSWYGKDDELMVELVVQKYRELHLDRMFLEHSKQNFDSLVTAANELPKNIPTSIFHHILSNMFIQKRNY